MRIIDYLVSFNGIPQISQDIYAQQIVQTYKEMQDINNAKKINLMREQTIVDIYKSGTENQILQNYRTIENKKEINQKKIILEKETYEISFTKFRFKKNYNKGNTIDLVV
ncbi:MAG: hypothetical protein KatS3mg129_2742 [Leptospiraceae bacterium]|nr:MAG: hypothetical protein KatS3mg129_2742 [Leptospiraceae bacterium]